MLFRRLPGPLRHAPVRTVASALLLLGLLAACGVKGPLVPLRKPLPVAPAGLSVRQLDGQFLLSWGIPQKNQDGTPLTDLAGFRVFRMRYNPAEDCPECRDTSVLFRQIDLDYLHEARRIGTRLYLRDDELDLGYGYRYRVVSFTRSGFGGAATVAKRIFLAPPPAPTGLSATALDHLVRLSWEPLGTTPPHGKLLGYNVYRRVGDRPFPPDPVNSTVLSTPRFEDFGATNDTSYHYAVRSVVQVQKQTIESALSAEVAATPRRGQ